MYTIEAFYFPTRIILIDDDPAFLQILSSNLSKKFLVKTFNTPKEALIYLKNTEAMLNAIRPNALVDEALDYGERYLSLSKMNMLAENTAKQEMVTIVISDYVMPGMNGVEFFESVSPSPIMKILLTGNADLDLALYAFNRGIVDKFLLKNSPKIISEVEESILACQHGFFCKQSYPVLNSLHVPEDSLLWTRELFDRLRKVIQESAATSYYLIDNIGSYLLMNEFGEKIYFINMIERQFDEYLDVAINAGAPSDIIEKLKNRTHAPVFLKSKDYQLSPKHWLNIMKIMNKNDYGYSCVLNALY